MKAVVFLTLALGMIGAPASSQISSDHTFFPAVMRGDIEGAKAIITGNVGIADWERTRLKRKSLTSGEFFERVKPCYFRIAFAKTDDKNREVGVWMCALKPTKTDPHISRTVLVQATYAGGKVSLDSYSEQESMNPAPAVGE